MVHYEAKPTSRKKLSRMAHRLREIMGVENEFYFPIIEVIELVLPRIDENFQLEIVEENELPSKTYALTYPDESRMQIRRDVYENAYANQGRARFTLAHELCHYLIHDETNISFARGDNCIPAYMNPEWQANTFAAELLVPSYMIDGLSTAEISEKCKVSTQCANIQNENLKRTKR